MDVDAMDTMLVQTMDVTFHQLVWIVSILVLTSVLLPLFLTTVVPLMALYYLVLTLYRATAREVKRLDAVSRSPLYAHATETLDGLVSVRAYHAEAQFQLQNARHLDHNNRAL